jgi:hypothetical protein
MKWKVIGSTLLAAMAVGIAVNFKDIKRYIRLSTM